MVSRLTSTTSAWRVTDQKPVRSSPRGSDQTRPGVARMAAKASWGIPAAKVAGSWRSGDTPGDMPGR